MEKEYIRCVRPLKSRYKHHVDMVYLPRSLFHILLEQTPLPPIRCPIPVRQQPQGGSGEDDCCCCSRRLSRGHHLHRFLRRTHPLHPLTFSTFATKILSFSLVAMRHLLAQGTLGKHKQSHILYARPVVFKC